MRALAIRVADFRSLTNIEVQLDDLTLLVGANNAGKTSLLDAFQFAIGANRRLLGKEDIRLGHDEADVPKERRAVVDILIRPVGTDGKIIESFPESSFWTNLWGKRADLDDFVACYKPENRAKRKESERFRPFAYTDLITRDKTNLDIFWLKDDSLEDASNLPPPDVIAAEIIENLEAALEQFRGVAEELEKTS